MAARVSARMADLKMNKIMTAALTLALLGSTAQVAQAQDDQQQGRGRGEHSSGGRPHDGRPHGEGQPDHGRGAPAPAAGQRAPEAPPPTQPVPHNRSGQAVTPQDQRGRGEPWRGRDFGPRPEAQAGRPDGGREHWNGQRPDAGRRDWDDRNRGRGEPNRDQRGRDYQQGRDDWRNRDDGRRDYNDGWRDRDARGWRDDGRGRQARPRYDRRYYPPTFRPARRYHGPSYRAPPGFYARSWVFGEILPRGWYEPRYRILDWWAFGLPPPPLGFDWVRVGDDAVLVDEFDGRIVQVALNLFW
jgi:Ni/Co efflux regulator RcnB